MKVGRRPRLKSSKKYKTSTKLRSRLKITIDAVVVEATETATTETTVGTTIEITRETTTTTKTETTDKAETGKEDPSTSRKKLVANKNTRRNLIMRDLEACKRIAAPMKAPEVETEEKEAEVARETMTAETSKKSRKKK